MIKFLIGFVGWFCFIRLEVGRNYQLIEVEKERPNYLLSFVIRSFFGAIGVFLMEPSFDPIHLITWLQAAPAITFEVCSFYLIFDPWLNKKRGIAWDYQGKNSGWLDKLKKGWYYTLKIICLVGLVVSIKILFQ